MSKLWHRLTQEIQHHGRLALALTCLGSSVIASAEVSEQHSLSDIATLAAVTMQKRAHDQGFDDIDVTIRPLDSRLKLSQCQAPLKALPANTRRALGPVSVGVRCATPKPWTLYVRGQVSATVDVPVLTASVQRGELLSADDVVFQTQRVTAMNNAGISRLADIVGKEARRTLRPGQPVRYSDLKAPTLIERGQLVSIVSGVFGLAVSMEGKALANGGAGDRILVANTKTGKRLEGVIAADGSVLIQ